jgi:Fe-Mn family superoxide dismutase
VAFHSTIIIPRASCAREKWSYLVLPFQGLKELIMMTRRDALKTTAVATLCAATAPSLSWAAAGEGPFKLPALPYSTDALEPHIDARTMEIHHGKHHAAYVANLNKALGDAPTMQGKSVEQILQSLDKLPASIQTTVQNNGGGHFNHELFWQMLKPRGGGEPKGDLAQSIEKSFGSFSGFKERFTEAATKVFGSGWAWLVRSERGLEVVSTPNQDSPIMKLGGNVQAKTPLLGLDVWEHAYYLKYQNKRADYIAAFWNVVNWDFVAERYSKPLSRTE